MIIQPHSGHVIWKVLRKMRSLGEIEEYTETRNKNGRSVIYVRFKDTPKISILGFEYANASKLDVGRVKEFLSSDLCRDLSEFPRLLLSIDTTSRKRMNPALHKAGLGYTKTEKLWVKYYMHMILEGELCLSDL
jgi:hypothetical protein